MANTGETCELNSHVKGQTSSQEAALAWCELLLQEKKARYRRLDVNLLPQAPSSRLRASTLVFPGSKSPLNQLIFISEPATRDSANVSILVYSKNLNFPASDIIRICEKVSELNSERSAGLWKVEVRNGACFPVLESTVWFNRTETNRELLWRACGTLDAAFKSHASDFNESENLENIDIKEKVREFLVQKGFKKMKETELPNGRSFLLALSNDDEGDDSLWKRFPMKIEVTDLITFRCYFSLGDRAINANKGFINSSKSLLAEINSKFTVGFYNFVHNTKQLQFTVKLHYKSLSPSGLTTSLSMYYDHAILNYKWTVRALASLYAATNSHDSVSQLFEYVSQISDELQGEFTWRKLDYANLETEQIEKFRVLMERLSQSNLATPYFPPQPYYWLQQTTRHLYLKNCKDTLTLRDYMARFPTHRDKLCYQIAEMIPVFADVMVFPSPDMLYCKDTFPPQLIVIPSLNLHEDKEKFISEMHELILSELASLEQLTSIVHQLNTASLRINSEYIIPLGNTSFEFLTLAKGGLAGDNYLFYRLPPNSLNQRFLLILQLYQSELGHLGEYPNPLIGWTDYSEDDRFDASTTTSLPMSYSLCERFNYRFWRGDEYMLSMLKFLIEVESLHAEGKCHWFISPLTLRQDASNHRVAIVLPAIRPLFAELLYTFLSESSSDYLAPEVLRYLHTGTPVADLYSADVYSLCRCISEKIKVTDVRLRETVERGMERNPSNRPTLREVRMAIEELVGVRDI